MTLFELVKQTIQVRDAAEHYGLQINHSGMCRCPFHEDRHPSMKLNERYFYCFGCGATGDVIDLVARLFGLSSFEAAQKLAQDFGIDPDKPPAAIALPKPKRPLLPTNCSNSWRSAPKAPLWPRSGNLICSKNAPLSSMTCAKTSINCFWKTNSAPLKKKSKTSVPNSAKILPKKPTSASPP